MPNHIKWKKAGISTPHIIRATCVNWRNSNNATPSKITKWEKRATDEYWTIKHQKVEHND